MSHPLKIKNLDHSSAKICLLFSCFCCTKRVQSERGAIRATTTPRDVVELNRRFVHASNSASVLPEV